MALDMDGILEKARQAALEFRKSDQAATDRIVAAACAAGFDHRIELARMAVEETRLGNWRDKAVKNMIATRLVHEDIKSLRSVGIISEDPGKGLVEVAHPVGPIFAITPITNPTSTALFKILIAMKSRNPIIIRPHGAARQSTTRAAKICYEAVLEAGAPENCIQWIKRSTPEETLALMGHRHIAMNLVTGSVDLVRAAQRSGNPTLGVGPGNVPVYIGESADVPFAVDQIFKSKTFDYGTICASEQSMVVRARHARAVKREFSLRGAYYLSADEITRLGEVAYNTTQRIMRIEVIGQPATRIAEMAKIDVPVETTLLIAELDDMDLQSPLANEILAPILASYVVNGFEQGVELCRRINHHGGLGHTVSLFTNNETTIARFAEEMNAGRILVNQPSSQGALGGLFNTLQPSLTLGCGMGGKNMTTDNISARHLLNIQRIARRRPNEYLSATDSDLTLDPAHTSATEDRRCNGEA